MIQRKSKLLPFKQRTSNARLFALTHKNEGFTNLTLKGAVPHRFSDLQYQTELNNLNISLIILATIFITFIFSPIPIVNEEVVFILKFFSIFIAIVFAWIIIIIFNSKLSQTKEMIKGLSAEEVNMLIENITLSVHIIVLITILFSFILLIRKRKYDCAIALFIMLIAYIVLVFVLKR